MGDTRSYYEDRILDKREEYIGKNVELIVELYKLLKVEEKVQVREILKNLNIF